MHAAISVDVTARDGDGVSRFEGTIPQQGASFAVPAGSVQLQIAVRNESGEIIDSETETIAVPEELAAGNLVWGTPVLLRARSPQELKALIADPHAPPFAGNEFTRSDRLLVRTQLFGNEGSAATVVARLKAKNGTALVPLPVGPLAGRPGLYQIDLPMGSIAPGDFIIALEATSGEHRAQTMVAIRVVG
jgi:hypothetical protein